MKRFIAILLAAALLTAAGCTGTQTDGEAQDGDGVQIPNPIVEVEDAAAFEELGISFDAPEGAADVVYSIISDEIAQIQFTYGGRAYTYRASCVTDIEDMHGVYETFDDTEQGVEADGADWYASVRIRTVDGGKSGALASWSYDPVNYTLWTADEVDTEAISALAVGLAEGVFPRDAAPDA